MNFVLVCFSWSDLLGSYLNCVLSAFLGYLLVHTCIFHAYLNMTSEILTFADREFYEVRGVIQLWSYIRGVVSSEVRGVVSSVV